MSILSQLFKRDDAPAVSHTTIGLLVALLIVVIIASALVGALIYVRRRRRARQGLPLYNEKRSSVSSTSSHRRVTVRPSESIIVVQEKKNLLDNSDSPPNSALPEIRITFPEEFDDAGKRTSGRVVVVRVGDTSFGLEPLSEEKLPAYEQRDGSRFHSIDLERIGGLTEKDIEKH